MSDEARTTEPDGIITRRRIVAGFGAIALSAGLGLVATSPGFARETEAGDDRGSHDENGRHGNDDTKPDDRNRNRHRRHRGGRH
jgi:hypothetical protein